MIPAKDIRHVQFPSLLRIVINETGSRAYVGPRDNIGFGLHGSVFIDSTDRT